ncbi:MAG TPA: class I SAM-dependent methyltransferase [Patescibacteria group bacterium]
MTPSTITQLNQLNHDFYQKVAHYFDNSRQYYWQGWQQLIPIIKKLITEKPLRVLDLGSGNGRFLEFLKEKFPNQPIQYLAVDSNEYLLAKEWQKSAQNFERSQFKIDITDALLSKSFTKTIEEHFKGKNIDLIVSFGFLHHIPSLELRQEYISQLVQLSAKSNFHSVVILTAWQFADDDQQQKKIVNPSTVKIDSTELEPNDYILSWNRGVTAYRYCHHVDEEEVNKFQPLNQNLSFSSFYADGKSGQLNHYLVWQKRQE